MIPPWGMTQQIMISMRGEYHEINCDFFIVSLNEITTIRGSRSNHVTGFWRLHEAFFAFCPITRQIQKPVM